jgi:hypothetical protein
MKRDVVYGIVKSVVFLVICLWGVGTFAATEERPSALQIKNANTKITFTTGSDKDNNPANGSSDALEEENGVMRNIAVENPTTSTNIKFFEGNEEAFLQGKLKEKSEDLPISVNGVHFLEGNFSGKTLTLNNEDIDYSEELNYLISATTSLPRYMLCPEYISSGSTETVPAQYVYTSAAVINLDGVHDTATTGNEHVDTLKSFTVKLDNTGGGKNYRFSAKVDSLSQLETDEQLEEEDANVILKKDYQYKHAVFFGVPTVHLIMDTQTYDRSNCVFDPQGAKVGAFSFSDSLEGSSAVFGIGAIIVEDENNSSKVIFNDWKIGRFGNETMLTSYAQFCSVFGAGFVGNRTEFKNWTIGTLDLTQEASDQETAFGDYATLTATANGSNGQGNAAVFGAGWANNNSNFSGWTIRKFGDYAKLTATATASNQGTAAVFGTGWSSVQSDFSGWTIGTFGTTATLTATASDNNQGNAAVFGTGWADNNSDFSGWTIGTFGTTATLTATANSIIQGNAAVFGTSWANVQSNFNDWKIGTFGDYAALTATATATATSDEHKQVRAHATVFGTGWANVQSNFNDWKIGTFGNHAKLTATATSIGQTSAAVFGTGWANDNSNFNSWKIGTFGDHAKLTATATSGKTNAAVFGTGWANFQSDFSGWTIGTLDSIQEASDPETAFGDHATLNATATSDNNQGNAAVFGTGWANFQSDFSGWKIGTFGTNATLKASATTTGNQGNAAVFGTGWASVQSNFSGWTIGTLGSTQGASDPETAFGDHATLNATATATGDQGNAAVFGTGWANNNSDFSGWKIGNFGTTATLTATATATSTSTSNSQGNAAVFGTGWANDNSNFSGWKIGTFGDHATLKATANSSSQGNAAVFGTGWAYGNLDFSGWTIGTFGTNATLTATANSSSQGNVAVFGAGWVNNNPNFKNWKIGNFGDYAALTATAANSSSQGNVAVFGTGWANVQSNFSGWTIGTFGTNATLTATATATAISYQANVVVFGTGWSSNNSNFNGWKIGTFGDHATLTATANSSIQGNAAVFGTGRAYGNLDFSGWTIGTFGTNATLTATATAIDCQANVAVFGTGWSSNNSNFSGWKIGNFGDHAALTAIATSNNQGNVAVFGAGWANVQSNFSGWTIGNFGNNLTALSHTRYYSSVFGAGWLTDDNTTISDWTVGNIGNNSTLFSSSFCSTVFGSARLNDLASANNWTIGNIGDNATFVTYSSNDSFTYAADHNKDLQLHYGSFGSVFGSAFNEGIGNNPNNWTVEFQGNALCSSIGANGGGTANIHLGTLGGDKSDNFRFYFNAIGEPTTPPVVTVAALKLTSSINTTQSEKAKLILSPDQGQGNAMDYARAIAFGPNFQLNIGRGRIMGDNFKETEISIAHGGEAKGSNGTMNIFGAASKARFCLDTQGSVMRVHSGWTVNAYGPVEDLNAIDVDDSSGAVFNVYENIRNVTFVNGTTKAQGKSDGVGIMIFNGGNLRIAKNSGSNFDGAVDSLKNKMAYMEPSSSESQTSIVCKKGPDGIEIDASAYPWKGTATSGKLILKEGDLLIFHVDSSKHLDNATINILTAGDNDTFEFVNGCIFIEEGVTNAIVFEGGKIAIKNDDPINPGFLPAHSDFLIAQMVPQQQRLRMAVASESEETTDSSLPMPITGLKASSMNLTLSEGTFYTVTNTNETLSREVSSGYSEWDRDLDLFVYKGESETALYIGSGENPRRSIPTALALRQANAELAGMSIGSVSLLRHTVTNRLTDIKENGDDPFLAIADGHFRQDEIDGFGYNGELHGIVGGFDRKYELPNEHYLDIGITLGFFNGHTKFCGAASSNGKDAKHTTHGGAIFTAYESFGKNNLKTNANLFVGIGRSEDKLYRMDSNGCEFQGKMRSNNQFVKFEVIKNLLSSGGIQTGPWLFVDYNRVSQDSYDESYVNRQGYEQTLSRVAQRYGAQTLSKVKHDFLDTVIGLNLEKEIQDKVNFDSGLRMFLKAGWHRQLFKKHSHATVRFDIPDLRDVDTYSPTFAYPKGSSIVFVAGFRKKFDQHWKISGNWRGTFTKNARQNLCSIFLGYDF